MSVAYKNGSGQWCGRLEMFIPYTWLSVSPQGVLVCGDIPIYFSLSERNGRDCLITLSSSHRFNDSDGGAISVPVGTAFEVEYRGTVCEIKLGRRLVLCDAM